MVEQREHHVWPYMVPSQSFNFGCVPEQGSFHLTVTEPEEVYIAIGLQYNSPKPICRAGSGCMVLVKAGDLIHKIEVTGICKWQTNESGETAIDNAT